MIRKTLLAAALTLAFAAPLAAGNPHRHDMDVCDASSDYGVRIAPAAVVFTRDDGTPRSVEMSKGRLRVDGVDVALSREDTLRIADYEATVRELIPQVKEIALDAVDIAFTAVQHVARTFSDVEDMKRTSSQLADARVETTRKVEAAFEQGVWSDREFEELVETTVGEIIPIIIGDVVGSALAIAFTGDEKAAKELETRVERMEKALESEVEKRAEALEDRAEALCPVVAELDRIEQQLEVRIAGARLDLIAMDD